MTKKFKREKKNIYRRFYLHIRKLFNPSIP